MKSFSKKFYLYLIFFIVILAGVFASNFIYQVSADEVVPVSVWESGSGTMRNPYKISNVEHLREMRDAINSGEGDISSAHYQLMGIIVLREEWTPIGTETYPFSGTFDGNGKSISGISVSSSEFGSAYLGLFGKIQNATIKRLEVSTTISILNEGTVFPRIEIGGIVGRAINSQINNCQIELKVNESSYAGEIVAGGAVGYSEGLIISQCGIKTEINITQVGEKSINSLFGGAVGHMSGGEISFVYIAPSNRLIGVLRENNGALTAVSSLQADIIITNNNNSNESTVAFGGLLGYVGGDTLRIFNNIYSSLYYTATPSKVKAGGIVGRIFEGNGGKPAEFVYSKYLKVQNSPVSTFDSAIGNFATAGYTISSTNASMSAIPTSESYTADKWLELRPWDFEDVWKNESTVSYAGYFFPRLQDFSTYTIKLSTSYAVEKINGEYASGYVKLSFIGKGEGLAEESFSAGETARIQAVFYQEDSNIYRDFKHYYAFTNWLKGDTVVVKADSNNSSKDYNVVSNGEISEISFVVAADKEGTYGVNITGREVKVRVNLFVEGSNIEEGSFGSVDYFTAGNTIENKTTSFEINAGRYQSGVAIRLEAKDLPNSEYIFSRKWEDDAVKSNIVMSQLMSFELDNNKKTTSSKLFPRVLYDVEEGALIATINCYFSNNTALLTIDVSNGGNVSIAGGEEFSDTHTQNIIKNKDLPLEAIAKEGYKFVGWEIDGTLYTSPTYYIKINTDKSIIAKFEPIAGGIGSEFPIWAIVLIIASTILIIGITIFIVIRVKRNSFGNYRKNYKY